MLAPPGALHPIVVVYTIVHSSRSTAPGAATFSDFEYSWLQILHLLRESPKITYKVSFRPHCSIVIRVNHDHRLSVPTSAKTPFVQLATDRVEDGVGKKPAARSVSKQAGSSARTKKLADAKMFLHKDKFNTNKKKQFVMFVMFGCCYISRQKE